MATTHRGKDKHKHIPKHKGILKDTPNPIPAAPATARTAHHHR
jgi:hypothetical protein